MKITEHFTDGQFGWALGTHPDTDSLCLKFCASILEPIRAKFGPLRITSGYRSPEANQRTGGVPNSFHQWNEARIACDFQPINTLGQAVENFTPLSVIFDWLCLDSDLPFDKVIWEVGGCPDTEADDCIHIQFQLHPRREAFTGQTHGKAKVYAQVEVSQRGPVPAPELWGDQ